MSSTQYHIHVNHFATNLPTSIDQLERLGFKATPAYLVRDGQKSALWLIAKKVSLPLIRDSVYQSARDIIKDDVSFEGYIESETVASNCVTTFEMHSFSASQPFPLHRVNSFCAGKVADIHIYRPRGCHDALDSLLEANGFYLVETERKKIWTLLLPELRQAAEAYRQLRHYFKTCGGIIELELEVINKLEVVPQNWMVPAFLRPTAFALNHIPAAAV